MAAGTLTTLTIDIGNRSAADLNQVLVDWGDGTDPTAATAVVSSSPSQYSAQHTYSAGGLYSITVSVTDNSGDSASNATAITATVTPTAAIDDSQTTSFAIGSPITLAPVNPSDTDSYAWTVSTDALGSSVYTSGSGEDFSFTPDNSGSYYVWLTAQDAAGTATSPPSFYEISAGNAPCLTIDGVPTNPISEGTPIALTADMANPNAAYTYSWTVTPPPGDQSNQPTTFTGDQITYSPDVQGTYAFNCTATDAYEESFSANETDIPVTAVAPTAVFTVNPPKRRLAAIPRPSRYRLTTPTLPPRRKRPLNCCTPSLFPRPMPQAIPTAVQARPIPTPSRSAMATESIPFGVK